MVWQPVSLRVFPPHSRSAITRGQSAAADSSAMRACFHCWTDKSPCWRRVSFAWAWSGQTECGCSTSSRGCEHIAAAMCAGPLAGSDVHSSVLLVRDSCCQDRVLTWVTCCSTGSSREAAALQRMRRPLPGEKVAGWLHAGTTGKQRHQQRHEQPAAAQAAQEAVPAQAPSSSSRPPAPAPAAALPARAAAQRPQNTHYQQLCVSQHQCGVLGGRGAGGNGGQQQEALTAGGLLSRRGKCVCCGWLDCSATQLTCTPRNRRHPTQCMQCCCSTSARTLHCPCRPTHSQAAH